MTVSNVPFTANPPYQIYLLLCVPYLLSPIFRFTPGIREIYVLETPMFTGFLKDLFSMCHAVSDIPFLYIFYRIKYPFYDFTMSIVSNAPFYRNN